MTRNNVRVIYFLLFFFWMTISPKRWRSLRRWSFIDRVVQIITRFLHSLSFTFLFPLLIRFELHLTKIFEYIFYMIIISIIAVASFKFERIYFFIFLIIFIFFLSNTKKNDYDSFWNKYFKIFLFFFSF